MAEMQGSHRKILRPVAVGLLFIGGSNTAVPSSLTKRQAERKEGASTDAEAI